MSGYVVNPHLQFTDENGKPLAFGTIETYIAGTSIPYATMKDFTGTMNPSTITLDDDGSCSIIIPDDQLIKIVIRTNEGRLFRTYDNVASGGSGGKGGGDYLGSTFIAIDQIARVISLRNIKPIITDNTLIMEDEADRIVLSVNPQIIDDYKPIVAGPGIHVNETDSQIEISSATNNIDIQSADDKIEIESSYDKDSSTTTFIIDGSKLALETDLEGKQDKLTAGNNITIENNVISADTSGLPPYSEASHGDVLMVRRSGAHGGLGVGWYPADTKVFIGHYTGVNTTSTTYGEFYGKFVDGYMCVLEVTILGGTSYYVMDTCDSSKITFTRSVPTSNGVKPTIAMYVLNNDSTYNYLYSNLATDYTSGYGIKVENNVISNTMHEETFSTNVMWSTLSNNGQTNIPIGSSPWRIELKETGGLTWDTFRMDAYIRYAGKDVQSTTLADSEAHYIHETWHTVAGTSTTHNSTHQNIITASPNWSGNNWYSSIVCNPNIRRYLVRCQLNTGYLNNDWIDAYIEWWLLGAKDETYTAGTSCNIRVWGTYHYM